jgi:hypothetical protein
MTKRASLTDALRHASGRAEPPAPASTRPNPPPPGEAQYITPARRGKKTIGAFFDPAVSKQLRQIALDEDSTVQDLMREAINDLFEKRGKARIA